MDFIGKVRDIQRSYIDREAIISFDIPDITPDQVDKLRNADKLRITIKQYRKKRSLDANAYYWQLLSKVADALRISKPHCHNLMLRRYGQIEFFNDKIAYVMLPDTEETSVKMEQMEESHFAPTSQTTYGKDGVHYRAWKLLKPSHRYDSKEYAILIDGLVDEAKELGIDTLSQKEIKRMVANWKA